ncbi:uncharacterized protein LOC126839636 isoform X2 [Adelges cooleyi]|uniref:uncharacterized protein LOC126839636 isoform X2 n=1 Tax=Adelges cooleyi TaxID=133065 RepID=UPI00217FE1AD|nr:uncharacterized protein LOC126839636 isoform X2 [Adelges cooleyi]
MFSKTFIRLTVVSFFILAATIAINGKPSEIVPGENDPTKQAYQPSQAWAAKPDEIGNDLLRQAWTINKYGPDANRSLKSASDDSASNDGKKSGCSNCSCTIL